jgi:hypothetical protein
MYDMVIVLYQGGSKLAYPLDMVAIFIFDRQYISIKKNTKFNVQLDKFCERGRIPLFLLVYQLNEIFL